MNEVLDQTAEIVKHWYIPLITGIIFIIVGIWAFFNPVESFLALTVVFCISFLVSGISEIFFSIINRAKLEHWVWTLILGIFTTLVGIMLINNPSVSMVSLTFYVGFLVMFRSFGATGISLNLKKQDVSGWWIYMILGILGILFSFFLIRHPVITGLTIASWAGFALVVSGIFNVCAALRLKKLQ